MQLHLLPGEGGSYRVGFLCQKCCAKFLPAICSVLLRICMGYVGAVRLLTCTMPEDLVNDN